MSVYYSTSNYLLKIKYYYINEFGQKNIINLFSCIIIPLIMSVIDISVGNRIQINKLCDIQSILLQILILIDGYCVFIIIIGLLIINKLCSHDNIRILINKFDLMYTIFNCVWYLTQFFTMIYMLLFCEHCEYFNKMYIFIGSSIKILIFIITSMIIIPNNYLNLEYIPTYHIEIPSAPPVKFETFVSNPIFETTATIIITSNA